MRPQTQIVDAAPDRIRLAYRLEPPVSIFSVAARHGLKQAIFGENKVTQPAWANGFRHLEIPAWTENRPIDFATHVFLQGGSATCLNLLTDFSHRQGPPHRYEVRFAPSDRYPAEFSAGCSASDLTAFGDGNRLRPARHPSPKNQRIRAMDKSERRPKVTISKQRRQARSGTPARDDEDDHKQSDRNPQQVSNAVFD